MKKKLLYIVLVWLAGIGAALGQVTGKATLAGQTDHSGIKVKFIALSPTAKTDSTVTNKIGEYTLNLNSGAYSVQYIKENFTVPFNISSTLILSNSILKEVFLFKNTNFISGNINRELSKDWYFVTDDIVVPISDSLFIRAGTHLFFANGKSLIVNGFIRAIGKENDSIYFAPYIDDSNINQWEGVKLQEKHDALFKYCSFLQAASIINQTCLKGIFFIEHSMLKNSGESITSISSNPDSISARSVVIKNCKFINNKTVINIEGSANQPYQVLCNYFSIYTSINLGLGGNGYFVDNILDFNNGGIGDNFTKVLYNQFGGNKKLRIFNNVFKNFDSYFLQLFPTGNGQNSVISDIEFSNNLIIGNQFSFSTFTYGDMFSNSGQKIAEIKNNNFSTNLSVYGSVNWKINLKNNILNGTILNKGNDIKFGANYWFPGFGQKITTNANGDSVDTYFNLFEDPKFLNGTAPYLAANSPAIGAGIDASGNPVNIGFDPTGTCLESYFPKPNTVVSADTLSIAGLVHQGSGLLSDGIVMAVEKASGKARYQKVNNGVFKLDSLRKSEYILYAVPNPVTVTGYLPTYYVNKVKLSEATPLNLLGKIKDVDIFLAAKPSVTTGNYAIQGRFSYADNNTDDTTVFAKSWFATSYTPASPIVITENPCKNLPVVLYNNNNQLVQSTVTDLDGYFVFNNLTSGTYKTQGQRVNYTTENNGVIQVGSTTTEIANLRLEQMLAGLEEENATNGNGVMAYPNPFKDELQLKGYKGAVSIHDLTGNLYFETTISENETIDASNWPSGFYLLKTGNKVQKIVKQD